MLSRYAGHFSCTLYCASYLFNSIICHVLPCPPPQDLPAPLSTSILMYMGSSHTACHSLASVIWIYPAHLQSSQSTGDMSCFSVARRIAYVLCCIPASTLACLVQSMQAYHPKTPSSNFNSRECVWNLQNRQHWHPTPGAKHLIRVFLLSCNHVVSCSSNPTKAILNYF